MRPSLHAQAGSAFGYFDIMSDNNRKLFLFVKMKITGIDCKIEMACCADTVIIADFTPVNARFHAEYMLKGNLLFLRIRLFADRNPCFFSVKAGVLRAKNARILWFFSSCSCTLQPIMD